MVTAKNIYLYRGFHSLKLHQILKNNWNTNHLTILIPAHLQDLTFLKNIFTTATDFEFCGDWDLKQITDLKNQLETLPEALGNVTKVQSAILAVFTSGTSTGRPKLIFYSKENILTSLTSIRKLFDVTRIKNIFSFPQPTHCFGLILGYMQSILFDHELIIHEGIYSTTSHNLWVKKINENTLTLGAPAHFYDLITYVNSNNIDVAKSYSAIIGGAQVTKKLWCQLQDKLNIEKPSIGYGASEASLGLTHLAPGMSPAVDGDIGSALDGVNLRIKDSGVSFSGKNVCLAIYENGELKQDSEIILNDELHYSAGRYTFLGRTDLVINRGGTKISLEAVETFVSQQIGCKCVAIAFYNERLGQDIALIIENKSSNPEIELNSLQQLLKTAFGFQIETDSIIFSKIPLNANNKYDRTEGLKIFLNTRRLTFPVSINYLKPFLHHAGNAVWLDSITEAKNNYGKAHVVLKENENYFLGSSLSPGSMIEFVAQTFGYSLAANAILNNQQTAPVSNTLIAEVKNFEYELEALKQPKVGDILTVQAECTHNLGAIKVIAGEVSYKEKTIAKLQLKIYCN